DGFYVASAAVDRTIKVWEVTSKELPLVAEHTGSVKAVAVSADGKVIASGATDRLVKLWDAKTGVESLTLPGHFHGVIALAFAPDGKTLVSSSDDRSIRLWDLTTGKQAPQQEGHLQNCRNLLNPARVAQVTRDGKRLLAWIPGSERYTSVGLFELATGQEVVMFHDRDRKVEGVAFTADGKKAVIGAHDGSVRIYDVETKQLQAGGDWFVFER